MEPDFMEPDFIEPDFMEPDPDFAFLDPSDFELKSRRRFSISASTESKPRKPPFVRVATAWSMLKTNTTDNRIHIVCSILEKEEEKNTKNSNS
jgi:hypothetical protein